MIDLTPYLFHKHAYGHYDCIKALDNFYIDSFGYSLEIPSYPSSRLWMRNFTTNIVEDWAATRAIKVSLTDAKNYDLMVFKSKTSNHLTHFAMYLERNKMFHVEEGKTSCIELLSDYWLDRLYATYRHDKMV